MNFKALNSLVAYLLLLLHCYLVQAQTDEPLQLNGELVNAGDVDGFLTSPDGQYVIYRADQDTDEVTELYSVPVTGGPTTKLNAPLVTGGNVDIGMQISADSKYVVYRADQNIDGVFELFSVPITGGDPIQLGPPLTRVSFLGFEITPNSERVVFRGNQSNGGSNQLLSVAIDGEDFQELTERLFSGTVPEFSGSFLISSDSQHAVFFTNISGATELFSVPVTGGGQPVQLNADLPDLPLSSNVFDVAISPDSKYVIYVADQNTNGVLELFSTPITENNPVRLNGELVDGGQIDLDGFQISPNSQFVIYRADQNTDNVFELFSAPIAGGQDARRLNTDLTVGGDVSAGSFLQFARFFQISPDSEYIVYRADQTRDDVFELFSVPINGNSNPIRLNSALATDGDVFSFRISPDSQFVVYHADQITNDTLEIFNVPITGGSPIRLNANLIADGDVLSSFQVSPDSQRVIYQADQNADDVIEIFSASVGGDTPTKINGPLPPSASTVFFAFEVTSTSEFVVYLADQNVVGREELFARTLVEISEPTANDGICFPILTRSNNTAVICL